MIETPNETHWDFAEALISLDLVQPFLGGMGLGAPEPVGLRDATRASIHRRRTSTPRPLASDAWPDAVEASLGRDARVLVERWVRYVFETAPSDHADWIAWHSVFPLVERSAEGFHTLGIPQARAAELVATYAVSRDDTELDALEREVCGADLSTWDLETCAVYGWLPDEPETFLWLWIRHAWQNHRFQVFFGDVRARLDDDDLERLFQRARALRKQNHLDVERLVDPRTLVPAVAWSP